MSDPVPARSTAGAGADGVLDEVVQTLQAAADWLADHALDLLHHAVDHDDLDGPEVARLRAQERQVTRARRAVERAVALLGSGPAAEET